MVGTLLHPVRALSSSRGLLSWHTQRPTIPGARQAAGEQIARKQHVNNERTTKLKSRATGDSFLNKRATVSHATSDKDWSNTRSSFLEPISTLAQQKRGTGCCLQASQAKFKGGESKIFCSTEKAA